MCVTKNKNSSEKLSNQVVIETERRHLVEFGTLKNLLRLKICILIFVNGFFVYLERLE